MNNKKELTADDLCDLLLENEITNFDPVVEAFKVFDVNNEGKLDGTKLKQSFLSYGFGDLSDEEFQILMKVRRPSYLHTLLYIHSSVTASINDYQLSILFRF